MRTEAAESQGAPRGSGAVVLLSGGMDSATLLFYVDRRLARGPVHALSCVYGQRHARELEAAAWQARAARVREHRVIDLAFWPGLAGAASALTAREADVPELSAIPEAEREQPPTYVPHRNLMLLAAAAGYAETLGIAEVFYGAQRQDAYGYWDCTDAFVQRLNDLLSLNRRTPVRVCAPFVRMRKADIVKIGLELGVDYAHTWTCYRGGEAPCGVCPSCSERANAFRDAGIRDPLAGADGDAAHGNAAGHGSGNDGVARKGTGR